MSVGYLPFGGGIRYYSVLLPVAILLMFFALRQLNGFSTISLLPDVMVFIKPFLPFCLTLLVVGIFHGYLDFFINITRAVFYAALLYAFLLRMDVNSRGLIFAPALACFMYAAVAVFEVFIQGRARAFGLVYENTFGQFSVLCAGISLLAALSNCFDRKEQVFLFASFAAGMLAAVLSGSRGALLPLIGVFCVFMFTTRAARLFSVFLFLSVSVFLYFDFFGFFTRILLSMDEVRLYFLTGHIVESSVGIRLELWRIALYSLLNSGWMGLGAMPFKDISNFYPDLKVGADYMDYYFGLSGTLSPWLFHGDIPQIMAFGGWVVLTGFLVSMVLVIRFSYVSNFALWAVWCGMVWGGAELFVFNRISFGLVLVVVALFCADKHGRDRL